MSRQLQVGDIVEWGPQGVMRGWKEKYPYPLVVEEIIEVRVRAADGGVAQVRAGWVKLDAFQTAMVRLIDEQEA